MASQQLCGVNVLAFYSSALYERLSGDENDNLLQNDSSDANVANRVASLKFGFGLANFPFTIPAYWIIDRSRRRGRWLLLLVSLAGIFIALIAISSFVLISDSDTRLGLVSFFTIVVFLFFYGIGAGLFRLFSVLHIAISDFCNSQYIKAT
ncbi:hypothetical protein BDW59DRAFT_141480 [Aspergillus cavernicola]|uniref:Major facilitator superfamily (MFS) profile domain-containing protein n=1 Tax=Aspergillus cavernicola TaxID=176166 RepID=A0ABR4ISU6_9EURO